MKLAVIILTHNEEQHVAACIQYAAFADEILVIDDCSTDRTRALAESAGARVIEHPLNGDFAAQRNFALAQTDADWVLYIDADERINMQTEQELRRVMAEDARAVYAIKRINVVFGRRMYHGGHRPDYPRRFFPRDAVRWEGQPSSLYVYQLGSLFPEIQSVHDAHGGAAACRGEERFVPEDPA